MLQALVSGQIYLIDNIKHIEIFSNINNQLDSDILSNEYISEALLEEIECNLISENDSYFFIAIVENPQDIPIHIPSVGTEYETEYTIKEVKSLMDLYNSEKKPYLLTDIEEKKFWENRYKGE